MTTIVFLGEADDVKKLMKQHLSKHYHIIWVEGKEIYDTGQGYEIMAITLDERVKLGVEGGIVILGEGDFSDFEFISNPAVVISNGENHKQMKLLTNVSTPVITCGDAKATISFSSQADGVVMITLNRGIKSLSGRVIQPLEIPVVREGCSLYSLMAFTALQLILDDKNSQVGRLYTEIKEN